MSELQTFLAIAILTYALCVIVQAAQELLKAIWNTKAKTMADVITQFMGDHLTLEQVKGALEKRGLKITALEGFSKDDFRRLLDGVQFTQQQLDTIPQVVALQNATVDQFKESIAAAYDGAMARFKQLYTRNNKIAVIAVSFVVVLALNSSVIKVYELLAVDQTMSQAVTGSLSAILNANPSGPKGGTDQNSIQQVYDTSRQNITDQLNKYPVLLRTREYPNDLRTEPFKEIVGLIFMGILVSLGAPFWNDVLKGANGLNNVLQPSGNGVKNVVVLK